MLVGGRGSVDLPDLGLLAVPAEAASLQPAIEAGLVHPLVPGGRQDELLFLPDDRCRPVEAGLDERQALPHAGGPGGPPHVDIAAAVIRFKDLDHGLVEPQTETPRVAPIDDVLGIPEI